MQNIVLTQTGGGTTSVTIHANEITENTTKALGIIPIPSSTRGTTVARSRIIDLQRVTTGFKVKGYVEDEHITRLDVDHNSSATTITVGSTTGFASSGLVKIEQELCSYTGTTSTSFTGVTRGVEGTVAAAHNAGSTVWLPSAQFRDDLYTIHDYGGCFQLAYRRKNWSVTFNSLNVTARPDDNASPRVFDIEFTASVGEDLIVRGQSSGLVLGRN